MIIQQVFCAMKGYYILHRKTEQHQNRVRPTTLEILANSQAATELLQIRKPISPNRVLEQDLGSDKRRVFSPRFAYCIHNNLKQRYNVYMLCLLFNKNP